MTVIATAGHVDHGKSTLVKVLSGTDPDRWKAEKERGLTIDLGFALARLPSGEEVSFVDVPGHVRFLKNMLAGVGAVQACLFVVDAKEGWKPQSEEHLRILQLLGIHNGLLVLTKVADLDDDELDLVRLEVSEAIAGSFLESAAILAVDSISGEGIGELRVALDQLLASLPPLPSTARPRLWVDRSFAAKGAGTVCTGTLSGGELAVDDELEVVGHGQTHRVRVRGLQSHNRSVQIAPAASRMAANLVGIGHKDLVRGDALVRPGQWARSKTFDATLEVLSSLDHDVGRRGAYLAYIGSGEHPVKMRVLKKSAIAPGEAGLVRLWLDTALALLPGDRYVLREAGRNETVGGGEVLDVSPVVPASRAQPDRSIERVIAERGWAEVDEIERLTGIRPEPVLANRWVASPELLAAETSRLKRAVAETGDRGLPLQGLAEPLRALAADLEGLETKDGHAYMKGRSRIDAETHPLLARIGENPFAPAQPAPAERADARRLERAGLLVDCDGIFFTRAALQNATITISELLQDAPQGVTVSQIRQALGTSRKYLLAMLARLDAEGVTRRRGDLRLEGPRMARLVNMDSNPAVAGPPQ